MFVYVIISWYSLGKDFVIDIERSFAGGKKKENKPLYKMP